MLDRLARRYGTHPGAVLRWSPEDLLLADLCLEQAEAETRDTIAAAASRGGLIPLPVPVILVE